MAEEKTEKKRKSKLEKIYELQANNKTLKEENHVLRREMEKLKRGSKREDSNGHVARSSNEEKLMEAMKALKRVTVKQEMSLNTIRAKAEQRRKQVSQRDEIINRLSQEVDTLKRAKKARKELATNGANGNSVDVLRNKIEDLELRSAEHENKNKMLSLQLEASEDKVKTLEKQLDSAKGGAFRGQSSRSLKSSDTSSTEYDVARMKKELASKIERIVLLEFDLEMCKDEIHELKQKQQRQQQNEQLQNDNLDPPKPTVVDDYFSDDDVSDIT